MKDDGKVEERSGPRRGKTVQLVEFAEASSARPREERGQFARTHAGLFHRSEVADPAISILQRGRPELPARPARGEAADLARTGTAKKT